MQQGASTHALWGPKWKGIQEKRDVHIRTADSSAVQHKLTQHGKATGLQQKCLKNGIQECISLEM